MSLIEVVGRPDEVPGPEASTEENLRKVLQEMDGLLDVKWVPIAMWNQVKSRWEGRYALIVNWPSADKRHGMVQTGEVDPKLAHDIVGWFCDDMQDPKSVPTSLQGIEDRVIALLGTMDNTRYPWKQRFMSTIEKNKKRHAEIKQEAGDMTADEADYRYQQVTNAAFGRGANFDKKGKLIK